MANEEFGDGTLLSLQFIDEIDLCEVFHLSLTPIGLHRSCKHLRLLYIAHLSIFQGPSSEEFLLVHNFHDGTCLNIEQVQNRKFLQTSLLLAKYFNFLNHNAKFFLNVNIKEQMPAL